MNISDILAGTDRDSVARASSTTYVPQELARLGLEITLNIGNSKNRYVGNPPVYPEIIIWRPDYQGSNTGQAVIVEEIETLTTLLYPRVNEWKILASISGLRFNLLIPATSISQVKNIISNNQIANINLQSWHFDTSLSKYVFTIIK